MFLDKENIRSGMSVRTQVRVGVDCNDLFNKYLECMGGCYKQYDVDGNWDKFNLDMADCKNKFFPPQCQMDE